MGNSEQPTTGLGRGLRALMPTCKDVARLQSDALDRTLSPPRRFGLQLHLLICKWCRRYGRQLRFMRHALRERSANLIEVSPQTLPAEARQRIKRSLESSKG